MRPTVTPTRPQRDAARPGRGDLVGGTRPSRGVWAANVTTAAASTMSDVVLHAQIPVAAERDAAAAWRSIERAARLVLRHQTALVDSRHAQLAAAVLDHGPTAAVLSLAPAELVKALGDVVDALCDVVDAACDGMDALRQLLDELAAVQLATDVLDVERPHAARPERFSDPPPAVRSWQLLDSLTVRPAHGPTVAAL